MELARRLASRITNRLNSPDSNINDIVNIDMNIPFSSEPCRECDDPCDEGHEEYPKGFKIDLTSELLGSVKPYRRQVVISTGQSDWAHDITDVKDSLAAHLSEADEHLSKKFSKDHTTPGPGSTEGDKSVPGVFSSSTSNRLSILNGSHLPHSHDSADDSSTILVFPDFTAVCNLEISRLSADAVWTSVLDPGQPRFGSRIDSGHLSTAPKTYVLPYDCVILLCSHKKRDNRCHIAAPKLESAFTQVLNAEGWEVDSQLRDLSDAIDISNGSGSEDTDALLKRIQSKAQEGDGKKKALILKTSHVGGHKFAGNVIIYTPQGSGVWYGRVSTHHVASIVKNTISKGEVLKELLRGGLNISRPGCRSLHDW